MKKTDIETIILQEAEIKRLQTRVRVLESGYLGITKENYKLRVLLNKSHKRENKLDSVNV